MTVMTEALRTTWQALNPREPKPSFLIAFFFSAMAVFGLGLLIGQMT
jgi:hypothetical protein